MPDDTDPRVIDFNARFCAGHLDSPVELEGKSKPAATCFSRRKPVHIKYGEVYPCRCPDRNRPGHGLEGVYPFKAECPDILPGMKRGELVLTRSRSPPLIFMTTMTYTPPGLMGIVQILLLFRQINNTIIELFL